MLVLFTINVLKFNSTSGIRWTGASGEWLPVGEKKEIFEILVQLSQLSRNIYISQQHLFLRTVIFEGCLLITKERNALDPQNVDMILFPNKNI